MKDDPKWWKEAKGYEQNIKLDYEWASYEPGVDAASHRPFETASDVGQLKKETAWLEGKINKPGISSSQRNRPAQGPGFDAGIADSEKTTTRWNTLFRTLILARNQCCTNRTVIQTREEERRRMAAKTLQKTFPKRYHLLAFLAVAHLLASRNHCFSHLPVLSPALEGVGSTSRPRWSVQCGSRTTKTRDGVIQTIS